ncbi:MAG: glucosamine-6-phosphate deaminase, partial [Ignavibacteriaceae bacterium]
EPGTPFDTYSHIVELDEITKKIAQKYFSTKVNLSKGITLGMKNIMEAKEVILQLSGKKKSPLIKKLLETEINRVFPVSYLKEHSNVYLLVDSEAGS